MIIRTFKVNNRVQLKLCRFNLEARLGENREERMSSYLIKINFLDVRGDEFQNNERENDGNNKGINSSLTHIDFDE